MPVIGFLHLGSPAPNAKRLAGFRKGLGDLGFVEGQNVAIDYRWAEGRGGWRSLPPSSSAGRCR